MRRTLTLLSLLVLATFASAAPVITRIEPNVGFSFGPTKVTIAGTDLSRTTVQCPVPPPGGTGPGTCPVAVFFGTQQGFVSFASPERIDVTAVPGNQIGGPVDHRVVDVRLVAEGKGETTVANGFTFDALAEPGPENYTQYLLPLYVHNVPGAFGSLWSSEWTAYNSSSALLQILGGEPMILADPPIPYLPGGVTARMHAEPMRHGLFIYVPNPLVGSTFMSLRIRDVSEDATSYGAELPIVPTREFANTFTLIDIPNEPRYRATLRVYGASDSPQTVRVSIFDPDRVEAVKTFTVQLEGILHIVADPFPKDPAYAQIDLLTDDIRFLRKPLRIEVDNMGANVSPPPPAIWAFVSITNNETNQVTTITPQDR